MSYFLPLQVFWRMLMMVPVVLATAFSIWRYAFLALPSSIVTIQINSKNQLKLVRKDGQHLSVQVQANTVVTSGLTVLNCQLEEASLWQKILVQHVIILPDMVDAESYRQLRVWLRWGKVQKNQTVALDSSEEKMV